MLQPISIIILSLLRTMVIECGRPSCRFHKRSVDRYEPYFHWTRKLRGKTVRRHLSDEKEPIVREAIENSRNLEQIVREIFESSARSLELVAQGVRSD